MKKGGSPKKEMTGDIMLRGAMGGMPVDEYTEKPRPNLYNVIQKLREGKGPMIHRLVYLAKINEAEFRGDMEKEFTAWTTKVVQTQDADEIPLKEGQ